MEHAGIGPTPDTTADTEPGPRGSDTTTTLRTRAGDLALRVRVRPEYLCERSDPSQPMHVFAYHVAIDYLPPAEATSEEAPTVRLVDRRWSIVDAHGEEAVVQGEGLVGQQPVLRPGERFEYASYCPLRSSWGTMEGLYGLLVLDEGGTPTSREVVRVGRFYLVAE